jgi:hypothetical protein
LPAIKEGFGKGIVDVNKEMESHITKRKYNKIR